MTPHGIYPNAKAAGEAFGLSYSGVRKRCRSGVHGWHYVDTGPAERRKPRRIVTQQGTFIDHNAAAKAYGITPAVAYIRAKEQFCGWYFEGDELQGRSRGARAVMAPDGTIYPTVAAAAKNRGIPATTAVQYLRAGRAGWRYIDEPEKAPQT
jgi:hypothetical protein